jgi:hypothetical protein
MELIPVSGSGRLEWLEFNCGANVGALSPDGRWVACDEQGEIFVRSLADPTIVRQVSTDGGIEPVWCPSGELFFRKGRRWFAMTISFAPELHWNPPTPAFETDFLDTVGSLVRRLSGRPASLCHEARRSRRAPKAAHRDRVGR